MNSENFIPLNAINNNIPQWNTSSQVSASMKKLNAAPNFPNKENKIQMNNTTTSSKNLSSFVSFNSKPKLIKTDDEKISFDFFHTLGKILHNKKIDPTDNIPRAMKKFEMERIPRPQSYFNIQEIINGMKFEPTKFNEFLVENSFKHFKDLKEISHACDTFSLTDTFHNHTFSNKYTYEDRATTMSNYQTLLNTMACMCLNKSQYDDGSYSSIHQR